MPAPRRGQLCRAAHRSSPGSRSRQTAAPAGRRRRLRAATVSRGDRDAPASWKSHKGWGRGTAPALRVLTGLWVGSCLLGAPQDLGEGGGEPDVVCTPSLPAAPAAARAAAGRGRRCVCPTHGGKGLICPTHRANKGAACPGQPPPRRGGSQGIRRDPAPSFPRCRPARRSRLFSRKETGNLAILFFFPSLFFFF